LRRHHPDVYSNLPEKPKNFQVLSILITDNREYLLEGKRHHSLLHFQIIGDQSNDSFKVAYSEYGMAYAARDGGLWSLLQKLGANG
jgi:hypothetical protein